MSTEDIIKNLCDPDKPFSDVDLKVVIDASFNIVKEYELEKVKTHQLRRFFDIVKRIKYTIQADNSGQSELPAKAYASLQMLRPQLFYAAKKKREVKKLADLLSNMIVKIKTKEDFEIFMNFFESIVAFHNSIAKE